jgi:hypothetical protein
MPEFEINLCPFFTIFACPHTTFADPFPTTTIWFSFKRRLISYANAYTFASVSVPPFMCFGRTTG